MLSKNRSFKVFLQLLLLLESYLFIFYIVLFGSGGSGKSLLGNLFTQLYNSSNDWKVQFIPTPKMHQG